MTTQAKIDQLNHILTARLPIIRRWGKVEVTTDGDTFTILWSEPKVKSNTHPFESKQCPIGDLDLLINRNAERLSNEVKSYK